MNTKKELTGYPSIDKPQYLYYKERPKRVFDKDQTIYSIVFNQYQNMGAAAIEYLGVEWTFEQLKRLTDQAAASFFNSGLRCGDVVLIGVSNCPESLVTLLALNKIGAISKWFDVRAGEKDIEEYANESNCRYLIIFDMLINSVVSIIDSTKLEKVLIITPADSLSTVKRIGYSVKEKVNLPKDYRFMLFHTFVKKYNTIKGIECVNYDRNRPSVMVQSSGTTGKPKVIVHSDYSASRCVRSMSYTDLPIEEGKTLLNLLPPWIAYAIGDTLIYPLALGCKVILSPTFNPEVIMDYIGKFTVSFTAPPPYRYLYEHFEELTSKKKNAFFEKVDALISGGDKVTIEENKRFEQKFGMGLVNGYGDNEGWGCITVNPIRHNKYGSVGIGKYGDTVIAYDNENNKELPYNETGEICVLTDTMFLYYENNENETNAVKKKHSDGYIWLHTGDLGYIDNEGYLFLKGRLRRVITRLGFKLSAYTIEECISKNPYVKECVVVEVNDKEEEHVPMAFVVIKDGIIESEKSIENSILDQCNKQLKQPEIPKHIRFVNLLPYTQNGKYDFRRLEEEGNEYIESMQ